MGRASAQGRSKDRRRIGSRESEAGREITAFAAKVRASSVLRFSEKRRTVLRPELVELVPDWNGLDDAERNVFGGMPRDGNASE